MYYVLRGIPILYATCYLLLATPVRAATVSNQNYSLEMQHVAPGTPETVAKNDEKIDAPPPPPPLSSPPPFVFSLSDTIVDFGKLSATNPVTRTNTIDIVPGSAGGYSMQAFEYHELSANNNMIPDTTCDNGTCTQETASVWESILSYGLGYRENGFGLQGEYKRFANASKNEPAQAIMSGGNHNTESHTTVTYKVNISKSQPIGLYQNIITYIAVPNF